MGYRLEAEVLDNLPPQIDSGCRLLLAVLAQLADDETRRVIPPRAEPLLDLVGRRTGLEPRGVRAACKRLARMGLDPRVPIAVDRNGKDVFAARGRAVEYAIPRFSTAATEGGTTAPAFPAIGGTTAPPMAEKGGTTGSESGTTVPPHLSTKYKQQQPRASAGPAAARPGGHDDVVRQLLERFTGELDEQTARDCVAAVVEEKAPDSLGGYVARFDLSSVNRWAAKHRARVTAARDAGRAAARKCRHGTIDGRAIRGIGANASRLCGRCEAEDPASEDIDLVGSTAGAREAAV